MRADDVMAAAHLLASSLLGSLTDQDLAVFARRLVPLLWQEGKATRATGNTAYTVASLAAELGVSDKAIRCAIARHELRAVKRGSRWIISSDAVNPERAVRGESGPGARLRRSGAVVVTLLGVIVVGRAVRRARGRLRRWCAGSGDHGRGRKAVLGDDRPVAGSAGGGWERFEALERCLEFCDPGPCVL